MPKLKDVPSEVRHRISVEYDSFTGLNVSITPALLDWLALSFSKGMKPQPESAAQAGEPDFQTKYEHYQREWDEMVKKAVSFFGRSPVGTPKGKGDA